MRLLVITTIPIMVFLTGCAVVAGRAGGSSYKGWACGEKAASTLAGLNITETQSVTDGVLLSDRGVGVDQAGSRSESELTKMLGSVLLAGIAAYTRQHISTDAYTAQDSTLSVSASGAIDNATSALSHRFDAVPGIDNTGIYGSPGCGKCAAYLRANPDVSMINYDTYKTAFWDGMRARGYTAGSVTFPVEMSATAYQMLR